MWQEGERRAFSFSTGTSVSKLQCTFSINVISNMSDARLDYNCRIYNCCGCLEAARLQYLSIKTEIPAETWYNVHFVLPPQKTKQFLHILAL